MTGGVAVSVGGERDAALRNVADGLARLVSGRRGNGARASGGCGEEALSCWADLEGRWAERGERKERDWASSRVGLGWAGGKGRWAMGRFELVWDFLIPSLFYF